MRDNFAITTLSKNPNLYQQVVSLIEESFHYSAPYSFPIDFYPLMNNQNWHNNFLIINKQDGSIVSHVGALPKTLIHNGNTFNVTLLGGIATSPVYRGGGHFDNLINTVINTFTKESSLFILWSDLTEMYAKYGFIPAGDQLESKHSNQQLPNEITKNYKKTSLFTLSPKLRDQIKKIYDEITCSDFLTISRAEKSWEDLSNISSTDLYIEQNIAGEILSYFMINKGLDLQNVIHEIGYTNKQRKRVLELLSTAKIWFPGLNCKLSRTNFTQTYTALLRPGNTELFKDLVGYLTDHQVELTSFAKSNTEALIGQNDEMFTLPTSELIQHIFGPHYIKGLAMPIAPIYIPGCDSI